MSEWMTDEEFAASIAAMSLTQVTVGDFPKPAVVTVKGFKKIENADQPRQKWSIYVQEFDRPFLPCTIVRRVISATWGKPGPDWIGRKIRIYNDPSVTMGKRRTGGLRVDALSHWRGGSVEVDHGRGNMRKVRVDSLDRKEEAAPAQTFEDRRAALVAAVIGAGLLDDADAKFGPADEWDAVTCKNVAAWLREVRS